MIKLHAEASALTVTEGLDDTALVSGMANVASVQVTFSEDWAGMDKVLVFTDGIRTIIHELKGEDEIVPIPHELMEEPGRTLYIGVQGTDGERVILPTVMCRLKAVAWGADPDGDETTIPSKAHWVEVRDELERLAGEAAASESAAAESAGEAAASAAEAEETAERVTADGIAAWLDAHPEATTTVQDGAITLPKLAADTANIYENYVPDAAALERVLTTRSTGASVYRLGNITINEPITLSADSQIKLQRFRFIGGRITINCGHAFELPVTTSYNIPWFSGTEFYGNRNTLFYNAENTYIARGFFTDCLFQNVRLVTNANVVQSMKFVSCRFRAGNAADTFIKTGKVYDTGFESCEFDSDFHAALIDANGWYNQTFTGALKCVTLDNCMIEGRRAANGFDYFIITNGGELFISGLYLEACDVPIIYRHYAQDYGNYNTSWIAVRDSRFLPDVNACFIAYDTECVGANNNNALIASGVYLSYGTLAAVRTVTESGGEETVTYTEISRTTGLKVFNTDNIFVGAYGKLDKREGYTYESRGKAELMKVKISRPFHVENETAKFTWDSSTDIRIEAKKTPCVIGWIGGQAAAHESYPYRPLMLLVAMSKFSETGNFLPPTAKWILPPVVAPDKSVDDIIINMAYDDADPTIVVITFETTTGNRALVNHLRPTPNGNFYAVYLPGIETTVIRAASREAPDEPETEG